LGAPDHSSYLGGQDETDIGRADTTGVRLVLASCTDPARDREFNAWYDEYAASLTAPGYFADASRYRALQTGAAVDRPTYASLYSIRMADPAVAWPQTHQWFESRGGHPLSPLLKVAFRATYAHLAGPADNPAWASLGVRLADGPTASDHACESWLASYASVVAETRTGLELTAYRIVDGAPDPPQFLELYRARTHSAAKAYQELQAGLPLEMQRRRLDLFRERSIVFYRRVFAYPDDSVRVAADHTLSRVESPDNAS
jgi:hypothetical protein